MAARDRALAHPGGRARRACSCRRSWRTALDPGAALGPATAGILRRHDARRILHRDRPRLRGDERSRTPVVRRRHRADHLDHPHLGRLPRRLRLRRAADEPRRAIHRPLHRPEDLWHGNPEPACASHRARRASCWRPRRSQPSASWRSCTKPRATGSPRRNVRARLPASTRCWADCATTTTCSPTP